MIHGTQAWGIELASADVCAFAQRRPNAGIPPGSELRASRGRIISVHALASVLDGLAAAIFVVDDIGLILHANRNAAALLDERTVARREGSRLRLTDKRANGALAAALVAVMRPSGPRRQAFSLRTAAGPAFVVTVLPLAAQPLGPTAGPSAGMAAVCLRCLVLAAPSHVPAALSSLYGLTRRETDVLAASLESGTVPKVAELMGLAETTIRTHLKSIFRKTGVTRHTDLIRLVSAAADPFE